MQLQAFSRAIHFRICGTLQSFLFVDHSN